MKLKEFDIKLDIKESTQLPHFEVVVGDYDSNILNISLYDNDAVYPLDGLDVEIVFAKQDKTTVVQDKTNGVVIEDNIIKCTLASNTIAKTGAVYAEVRVLQGTKVLTSPRFRFYVRNPILNDKTVESSNEFPMLVQALEDAKGAAESLPEINSAIDNIRNAESELNQSIGQASALDDTLNGTIQSAEQVKDALCYRIETAGTAKTQLDDSISSASTSKSELDNSIAQAGTAKNELDGSIAQAGTVKGELDSSIATAGQTKTALDESIATGELAEFKDDFIEHKNDYATEIGTVTNLATTSKVVVGAINELNTNKADKLQEAWTTPTLLNGWVDVAPTTPFSYYKDSLGIVRFRGALKGGVNNTEAFSLPIGYRPLSNIRIAGMSGDSTTGRYDVNSVGSVKPHTGTGPYVYATNLTFRAEG